MTGPKTIVEAVTRILGFKGLQGFKKNNPIEYHNSAGREIRNDWGLWDKKSPLHKEFNQIGIFHSDDMSGILLETAHRILNGQPIDLAGQVEMYKAYWIASN